MGQKTNPNILRLGVTKNWNSKYIEKKFNELPFYDFNNIEIYNFVYKFFYDNNLNIHQCKINYSNNKTLQIFISYYASSTAFVIDKKLTNFKKNQNKLLYKTFYYVNELKIKNKKLKKFQQFKKNILNKNYLNKKINNKKIFIDRLSKSLFLFLNTKLKLFITLQQLNKKFKEQINKKDLQILKRNLTRFYKYKNNKFFKDGVNIIYSSSKKHNSALLIAEFIANQLSQLKRHNYFIRFVVKSLKLLKNTKHSKLKGIKIKISGRINSRPRSKHKLLIIKKELPLISINSKIDYAEKTAFTPNGTLGIKVWTLE